MKTISLTQGLTAKVDDADFEWLNQWKWCAHRRVTGGVYAVRTAHVEDKQVTVQMHCQIMGCVGVDHKNHDTLDNQRQNLRVATAAQSNANSRRRRNNTSGFKGVSWCRANRRWRAAISKKYRSEYIGYFASREEAALAYDAVARKHFGAFACLNFP